MTVMKMVGIGTVATTINQNSVLYSSRFFLTEITSRNIENITSTKIMIINVWYAATASSLKRFMPVEIREL